MISSFVFRLVCVSGPAFVLRICATAVKVERDCLHCLSCTKSAGRFSRHDVLNSLIKQTLGSADLPSRLELRGLYRTHGKRPDGVTMILWEMGKHLVWEVTVVDALAPCCQIKAPYATLEPPHTRLKYVKMRSIANSWTMDAFLDRVLWKYRRKQRNFYHASLKKDVVRTTINQQAVF